MTNFVILNDLLKPFFRAEKVYYFEWPMIDFVGVFSIAFCSPELV